MTRNLAQIYIAMSSIKRLLDNKCYYDGFFANLRNMLNSNPTFWIPTLLTPNLVYSLARLRYTILLLMGKIGQKNMTAINQKNFHKGQSLTGSLLNSS